MIETPECFVVAADWLIPMESEPVPNGFLAIANGIIEFVGSELPAMYRSAMRFHLDGFAILPGLINSHCHLEFSDLDEPIPAGDSFPDWIRRLLAYRKAQSDHSEQLAIARQQAITRGVRESYEAGVRWIVDMTTQPWEAAWILDAVNEIKAGIPLGLAPCGPIVIQPCVEFLDITQHRLEATLAFALEQAGALESEPLGRMGYAPHAPYTASRKMTQLAATRSRLEQRLVTMHLAESTDELEWLENRKGSFFELLGPFASDTYFEELGQITEHVQTLTNAWRATIAHGNYLSQNDLRDLAIHSKSMAIVHCPRTHSHFGHRHGTNQAYPLAQRMASGIRHFLGTDSRASNPDLNLWSEAQRVRAEHPSIASVEILKMITTDAADFLGIANRYGAIRVNQPATLTAIKLPANFPSPSPSVITDWIYDAVLSSETVSAPLEMVLRRPAE